MHKYPDHAINLAIHTRWNVQSGTDTYSNEVPMYCLVWRVTMPHILTQSDSLAQCHSNIYHGRAEDISMAFNPATSTVDNYWGRPLDTISTWMTTPTQPRNPKRPKLGWPP
eukprot:3525579-Amphidinium_carterae.6